MLGEYLVKLARESVESFFERRRPEIGKIPTGAEERKGAFVTIETFPEKRLRGCIGFTRPQFPLYQAVLKAAREAAFRDPRFPPLKEEELNSVVFEVSILSEPRPIEGRPLEYPMRIQVGKHGLLVEFDLFSGLLLPQVAIEYKWNSEEFLNQACMKAGLPPGSWIDPRVKVYTFTCEVYGEEKPKGRIKRIL